MSDDGSVFAEATDKGPKKRFRGTFYERLIGIDEEDIDENDDLNCGKFLSDYNEDMEMHDWLRLGNFLFVLSFYLPEISNRCVVLFF